MSSRWFYVVFSLWFVATALISMAVVTILQLLGL